MKGFSIQEYTERQKMADPSAVVVVDEYSPRKVVITVHSILGQIGTASIRAGLCGICYQPLRYYNEWESYANKGSVRIRHRLYHKCTSDVCGIKIVPNPWQVTVE